MGERGEEFGGGIFGGDGGDERGGWVGFLGLEEVRGGEVAEEGC